MRANFVASQSVSIAVPQVGVPIQHYLRQPQRLVHALTDPRQVEQLRDDCYRLKMKPRQFLALRLEPTVDIRIEAQADGSVYLASEACALQGIEFINDRFHLDLKGVLLPIQRGDGALLQGHADLRVTVDIPPMFWMTPRPIVETTGNSLLKSILLSVKQRLVHQLVADYQAWAQCERPATVSPGYTTPKLSINSSSV